MQTLQLMSRVDQDGWLHIPVPDAEHLKGSDVEVLVVLQPVSVAPLTTASIVDLLAMPDADSVEFEAPRLTGSLLQAADLS